MLFSLALILTFGLLSTYLMGKLGLPSLVGMLIAGIVIGPFGLNLIDPQLLALSPDIRRFALVIILVRAGLNLDIHDLKIIGIPALMMCFVPASFEILGVVLFAPMIFGISLVDALLLGSVLGAVSPAVIVPRMVKMIEKKVATDKQIPQLVLAGASVDDVFVIVIFSIFSQLALGNEASATLLLSIPASLVFGVLVGLVVGLVINRVIDRMHLTTVYQGLVYMIVALFLLKLEELTIVPLTFSALIAIVVMGMTLKYKGSRIVQPLSVMYGKWWLVAEMFLFILVGASMNVQYATQAGLKGILLIIGILIFRAIGVFISILSTPYTWKERFFVVFAYLPKATVQAAIGGIPLALGIASGDLILTMAVFSIILTAPLGAWLIDYFSVHWLSNK